MAYGPYRMVDLSMFMLRGMNQGWTRVPSVLNTVTETFSDAAKRSEVEAFRRKIESENKLGSYGNTFDNIIGKFIHQRMPKKLSDPRLFLPLVWSPGKLSRFWASAKMADGPSVFAHAEF